MASTNNALNNQSTTNIASTTQSFVVQNTDNTGTSSSTVLISVGGGVTTGDPVVQYVVSGDQTWTVGIDNSASDAFTISAGSSLGTNNTQIISTAGSVSWPLQSAFLAFLETSDVNATGDSSTWQLGSGNALTEIFDRAGDFNTNGVFTAPVSGQYFFAGNVQLSNCTINTGIEILIISSNRSYSNRTNRVSAATTIAASLSTLADMDAGDTCNLTVAGFGEAAQTETVDGTAGGGLINFFCGYLMG